MSRFFLLTVRIPNSHKSRNKEEGTMATTRNINVADIDVVIVGDEDKALYMTVAMPPPVQARHRHTTYTDRSGATSIRTYDPSGRSKAAFKTAIRQALLDLGVTKFPFFEIPMHLKITAIFAVSNEAKDGDNLMKYLKDAFTGVVYSDDRWVYQENTKKQAATIEQQFMKISVEEDR